MRNLHCGNEWPKNMGNFSIFQETVQRMQSSNGRKFTQSGHTVREGVRHRNLRSRTNMLAQVLQIIFGKEHLVKNRLISTLDKVIYYKGIFLQGSTKPLTNLNTK
jgi:hypothetical protein